MNEARRDEELNTRTEHEWRVKVRVEGEYWITVHAPDFETMQERVPLAYARAESRVGYMNYGPDAAGEVTVKALDWMQES